MSPVDQAFAQCPRSWRSVKALVKLREGVLPWLTEKMHLKIATTNSWRADFWMVFNKQWKNAEFLDFRTVYASMRLSLISRAGQNMRV